MAKKLEKVCNYKNQLIIGERYSLTNEAIIEYSFIITEKDEDSVSITYLDGILGRITYEPFIFFENPLTSLEKELL